MGAGFNVAALLSDEVSPAERAKIKRLNRGPETEAEATAAVPTDPSLALNPAFSTDEPSFSLAGNAPVGGGGSALGSALLGNAPPTQEAPAQPKLRKFEDTQGGKTAMALREARKKIAWWMPDFMANRNSRDMDQALEQARLEMAGDQAEARTTQDQANLLETRIRRENDQTRYRDENEDRDADRGLRSRELEARLADAGRRLGLEERELGIRENELAETRRYRELLEGNKAAAAATAERAATYGEGYNTYATGDPSKTGVFGKFAKAALAERPEAAPEEILSAQVQASQAGALPPMMSTPADRPPTVVQKATGRRFYQYPDGRLVPVEGGQ